MSEDLRIYLSPRGAIPGIGRESGSIPRGAGRRIGCYYSDHGSYRYVMLEHGVAIGALQVVSINGVDATVANVYVLPRARRTGVAGALLERARRDFDVAHAAPETMSADGLAWSRARR